MNVAFHMGRFRFNLAVLSGIVLLAVILGVVNNLRVYEEQRVPWFGGGQEEIGD